MSQNEPWNRIRFNRREFLKLAGAAAVTTAAGLPDSASALQPTRKSKAEAFVRQLRESLTDSQKKAILLPCTDSRRTEIHENWHIVPQKIGAFYTPDQQALIREIIKNLTSEVGWDKIQKQMKDDAGGLENYACCLFEDSENDRFCWVMTGRHLTLRADANTTPNLAFGGPIFYGHAVEDLERPDHPGNVWWHQARLANHVYTALDGKQQQLALIEKSPPEGYDSIQLKGKNGKFIGLPLTELSRDQKALVQKVATAIMEPFRKEDVDEILKHVKAAGGWDKCWLSFYQEGDLGEDKIWDRWKLEGPNFAWYFRGSPHVHAWVNVGNAPQ